MNTDYTEPNKEEREEKLPEDYETPFSPPQDEKRYIPLDYPTTDSDMDETEWYNEGSASAASTEFPKRPKRRRPAEGFETE